MSSDGAFEQRVARQRARLGALDDYLAAVAERDDDLAARLRPVLEIDLAPCRTALRQLTTAPVAPAPGDDAPVATRWEALDGLRLLIDDVAARGQRLLAGALVRATGADDGMCRLGDRLLDEITALATPPWQAVTIPSTVEQFDLNDGCIRVAWGSPDVANLALAVHELGHAASYRLESRTVIQGRRTIVNPMLARSQAIPEGEDVRALHLAEHWADAYAVYVAGPAPLAAMVELVLAPAQAQRATPTHPAPATRVAVMLGVLAHVDTGVHATTAATWIADRWADVVADAGATAPASPAVPTIVAQCVDDLDRCLPAARYGGLRQAFALVPALTAGAAVAGAARLVDIVNAAWLARLDPTSTTDVGMIAERATAIAGGVPAGV